MRNDITSPLPLNTRPNHGLHSFRHPQASAFPTILVKNVVADLYAEATVPENQMHAFLGINFGSLPLSLQRKLEQDGFAVGRSPATQWQPRGLSVGVFWNCSLHGRWRPCLCYDIEVGQGPFAEGSILSAFFPNLIVSLTIGAELTSAVTPERVTEATSDARGQTATSHRKSNGVGCPQAPWQPMGALGKDFKDQS